MKEMVGEEVIKVNPKMSPIYKITGTPESCKHTMASAFLQDIHAPQANVLTAEDEGCTWIFLLDALQQQERRSREWDRGKGNKALDHTISYLIQRKRKCWDFVPLLVKKPYATTTICHLVEIISMLGLVWTGFDVRTAHLSAEGNGHEIKSEFVSGLGILVRISRYAKPTYEGNRIIPCVELKRLCFGEVPSLFDAVDEKLQVGPRQLRRCIKRLLPGLSSEHRTMLMSASGDNHIPGDDGNDDDANHGQVEEDDDDEDLPIIPRECSCQA
jgi:hypothetical protein